MEKNTVYTKKKKRLRWQLFKCNQIVCYVVPIGDLYNPDHFNYGIEAWKAYENGCLTEDLIEEQKKVNKADLVIFQVIIFSKAYFCETSSAGSNWFKSLDPVDTTLWTLEFREILGFCLLCFDHII